MAGTFPALLKTLILCVVVGNNVALLPQICRVRMRCCVTHALFQAKTFAT